MVPEVPPLWSWQTVIRCLLFDVLDKQRFLCHAVRVADVGWSKLRAPAKQLASSMRRCAFSVEAGTVAHERGVLTASLERGIPLDVERLMRLARLVVERHGECRILVGKMAQRIVTLGDGKVVREETNDSPVSPDELEW